MGILSGMLIVLGVKFLTGKKLSLSAKPDAKHDDQLQEKKEQIPVTYTEKLFFTCNQIKQWIAKIFNKK
jgi:hypothetical protein